MQICSNFCNISKLILFGCGNDTTTTTILVSLKQRAASMWLARARSFLASCVLDEKSFSNYQRISRKAICIRKMNLTRLENGHHPAPDQLDVGSPFGYPVPITFCPCPSQGKWDQCSGSGVSHIVMGGNFSSGHELMLTLWYLTIII